jgi:hypothetical protein
MTDYYDAHIVLRGHPVDLEVQVAAVRWRLDGLVARKTFASDEAQTVDRMVRATADRLRLMGVTVVDYYLEYRFAA